jgi:hypothetical protein|tara:strand:+ start:539 stop:829 length:291 start_codon:yes stop_codon:yes gene_type:complete
MKHTHKIVNGIKINLTSEEIIVLNNKDTEWNNNALNRALETLRFKRNNLLDKTDWTSNSDVTMSSDMKTYRQALRDLPSGKDTVDKCKNAVFPTKP